MIKKAYPLESIFNQNLTKEERDMLMKQYTQEKDFFTENCKTWSVLEQIAREGARKMLQQVLELEVEEYIQAHTKDTESSERKTLVRNGQCFQRM